MKKVTVHANARVLGDHDYEFYVDDDATGCEIKQKIEEYNKISYEYDVEERITMTVKEFCTKKTQIGELCVFRNSGWIIGATWIDSEDLFTMSNDIKNKKVKSDEWGTLTVRTKHGNKTNVPCHYIDF